MLYRAAAVIIKNEKILLLHRQKSGRKYYVFPGGRSDKGETPEITAIREIKEETGLDIEIDSLLFKFDSSVFKRPEYFFVAKNIQGEAQLGGEELEHNSPEDHYEIEWVALEDVPNIELLPPEAKRKIVETFCK
jgi:8-oxo-dGTP diphosphatase